MQELKIKKALFWSQKNILGKKPNSFQNLQQFLVSISAPGESMLFGFPWREAL